MTYHREKFFPPRPIFKDPRIRTGRRYRTLLLHTPHLHTQMAGFDYNNNALRIERCLQALAYLGRKPLLQLQPTCKGIDQTSQFTEAGYTAIRYIPDMGFPEKWQYMMLAKRIKLNILHNDHLSPRTVFFFKQSRLDNRVGRFPVTRCKRQHGLSCPHRGFQQALAVGIFSQNFEYGFIMSGQQLYPLVVRKILYTVRHDLILYTTAIRSRP